jgi:hypothetical protein
MSFPTTVSSSVLILLCFIFCHAQQQPTAAPAIPVADQMRIRNLQFQQDKKLIEAQRLEVRYRELQEQIKADSEAIENVVREICSSAKIDTSVYIMDLDSLIFVPRNPRPKKEPNPK